MILNSIVRVMVKVKVKDKEFRHRQGASVTFLRVVEEEGRRTCSLLLIDQITIKTPNPKCRLYWCLQTGDKVSHVGISDPSCKLAHLYLLSSSPFPPV
jgi:hypothetical protein